MLERSETPVRGYTPYSLLKTGIVLLGIWKLAKSLIAFVGILNLDAGHTFGFESNRTGFFLQGAIKLGMGLFLCFGADRIARITLGRAR